jgi:hypothetical protein
VFIGAIERLLSGHRQIIRAIEALPIGSRELSYMNPSSKEDAKSNQETQAFDPLPVREEDDVHPAPDDDEKDKLENSETAQVEEDKERAEMITKEAMLRVTGGQL